MEAIALHAPAHGHEEEYTTTGIPHDKMGMWVFLCSEVMFFTGLIGSYIVLRFATPLWPPPAYGPEHPADGDEHVHPDLLLGHDGAGARRGEPRGRAQDEALPLLTLLFGATFLSIQGIEYWKLLHEGFNPHV